MPPLAPPAPGALPYSVEPPGPWPTPAPPGISTLKPTPGERITRWWRQGIQGTTIHGALVRSHGLTGSYSSVRRFLAGLEATRPQVTTVLAFEFGLRPISRSGAPASSFRCGV